jgi:hypothetical protein
VSSSRLRCSTAVRPALAIVFLTVSGLSEPLHAQEPLSTVLDLLLTNRAVVTGDPTADERAAQATSDTITRSVLAELSNLPVSSSPAGFVYQLNPTLGTIERVTNSFGAFFTERALTSGRNRLSFGLAFREARFSELDGRDLRDGSFVTTANQFADEPGPFDLETLVLRTTMRSVTAYGIYGAASRVDVGVAVPFVRLSLEGERQNLYRGQRFLQASANASTSGLGDVSIPVKVKLLDRGAGRVAVGTTVRLPTGDEEDLLGGGEAAVRVLMIGSVEQGAFAAHGNFGLSRGGFTRGFDYAGAVTVAASQYLTLVGELFGRRLSDLGRITEVTQPHPSIRGVNTLRLLPTGPVNQSAFVVMGAKWNLAGTWLLSASVILPITNTGLVSRVQPVIGLEHSFGRQ